MKFKTEPVLWAQLIVSIAAIIGFDLSLEEAMVAVGFLFSVGAGVRQLVTPVAEQP